QGIDVYLPPGIRPRDRARRRVMRIGFGLILMLVIAIIAAILWPVNEMLPAHWDDGALTGAVVTGSAEGWAVGTAGLLLQVDGQSSKQFQSPVSDDLYAVAANPYAHASDAWAVGARGAILHWNGTFWNVDHRPTQANLYGVAVAPGGNVWAV